MRRRPTALSPAATTRSTPRAGCRAVTLPTSSTSPRAVRPRVHSSMSAVSTSGSTAIRVRTSAAPTGFAVSTTIRRPGPTASATRPPDSFTTTTATAIKISPTASLFSRVRRSTKRVSRATRSSTAPPLPRTSTTRPVTATGFPTTIFTARRTSCRASVSPSSGREPIRSSFPTGGNDAGEFVFFGGSFTQGGYYRGRSAVCRKLAADASGSLADIESGDGVTTYL